MSRVLVCIPVNIAQARAVAAQRGALTESFTPFERSRDQDEPVQNLSAKDQTDQNVPTQDFSGPRQVFGVTPALLATFGLEPSDQEQAEYAALLVASVASLIEHGYRLVLTAQVDSGRLTAGPQADNGGQTLDGLLASEVEAWFSDDEDAPSLAAATAVRGMDLDQAWDTVEVQTLVSQCDLMWHSITEQTPCAL